MVRKDITGKRFGRLTAIEFSHVKNRRTYWKLICDCGNEKIASLGALHDGFTSSCGCYNSEKSSKRMYEHHNNGLNVTHGMCETRLYNTWRNMKSRCYGEYATHYDDYGGRGISVCDEWRDDFQTFYNWALSNGYGDDLEIDRIDVNGNYKPSNCRWATRQEQSRNIRPNKKTGFRGIRYISNRQKWVSYIDTDGARTHLGYHDTMNDAITARKAGEEKYWKAGR